MEKPILSQLEIVGLNWVEVSKNFKVNFFLHFYWDSDNKTYLHRPPINATNRGKILNHMATVTETLLKSGFATLDYLKICNILLLPLFNSETRYSLLYHPLKCLILLKTLPIILVFATKTCCRIELVSLMILSGHIQRQSYITPRQTNTYITKSREMINLNFKYP